MTRRLTLNLIFLTLVILAMVWLGACTASTRTVSEEVPTPTPNPTATPTPVVVEDLDDLNDDWEVLGKPALLRIEKLDVEAEFEHVGRAEDGSMDVPQEWENVAWYEIRTAPGDVGNAVVGGHYDSPSGPAVFYELHELEVGDLVVVITDEDEELVFEVVETEQVYADEAPNEKIFGPTEERNLNLVTCAGRWDRSIDMYDQRLIVYTTLVDA